MTLDLHSMFEPFKALYPCVAIIPLIFLGILLLVLTNLDRMTIANGWKRLLEAGPMEGEPGPIRGDLATLDIVELFKDAGLYQQVISEGERRHSVRCPRHKNGNAEIVEASAGALPGFNCSQAECPQAADCQSLISVLTLIDRAHSGLVDSHCAAHPGLFKATSNECAFAVKHHRVAFSPQPSCSWWGSQEYLAARISFPADQMAVLSYEDEWTGSTLLPGSAFGIAPVGGDKGAMSHTDDHDIRRVDLFIPGRRQALFFDEDTNIRSLDNIPLRCHLSLHLYLATQGAIRAHLPRLAQSLKKLPQRIDERHLRALDILKTEFTKRTYRDCMNYLGAIVGQLNGALSEPDPREPIQMEFTTLIIDPQIEGESPSVHQSLVNRSLFRGDEKTAGHQERVAIDDWKQKRDNALAQIAAIPIHIKGLWSKAEDHAEEFVGLLKTLPDNNVPNFLADNRNFRIFPGRIEFEWISRAAQEASAALKEVRFRAAKEAREALKEARPLPSSSPSPPSCPPN